MTADAPTVAAAAGARLAVRPLRSFLFAPGNHARKVEKVFDAGADAVILDLEDACAIAEKIATRGRVVAALQRPRQGLGYVRINALDTVYAHGDLDAVVGPWLDGIVVPKVESAAHIAIIEWQIDNLERARGLPPGAIDLMPIIETAAGVASLATILASTRRVRRVSFGAGDYTRDLGMRWSLAEGELAHARAELVLRSRCAGLEPPIDTVFIQLDADAELARSAEHAAECGFQGKLCIHPRQIAAVHAAFTPTRAEIARARKIVAAFNAAEANRSASIQVDGYFVDYPIVEKALRVIEIARRAGVADGV